jgi:uncharacterized BrkB/YihY/UPF0761 family membrane protein
MKTMKIMLFIISILITSALSLAVYFIFIVILSMYAKYTNPHPEHGVMPLGALVYAVIPTIPISIFLLLKIYKWLLKKYE